jgi:ligand-binding sensor domain-containing protein
VARRLPGSDAFASLPLTVGDEPGDLGVSFAEDAAGTVWIAFASGRVVRQHRGGAFERVTLDPPLSATGGIHLAFDSRQRLWVLSRGAVVP